jgi:hypothetical protein
MNIRKLQNFKASSLPHSRDGLQSGREASRKFPQPNEFPAVMMNAARCGVRSAEAASNADQHPIAAYDRGYTLGGAQAILNRQNDAITGKDRLH